MIRQVLEYPYFEGHCDGCTHCVDNCNNCNDLDNTKVCKECIHGIPFCKKYQQDCIDVDVCKKCMTEVK